MNSLSKLIRCCLMFIVLKDVRRSNEIHDDEKVIYAILRFFNIADVLSIYNQIFRKYSFN